ncbi:polysaccharide lyase family 7 protein [Aaosphaeria arxii CBS 175.79]|uniref:Polysaccharide lyase family 7 protein n=1 Tax=Aaosphaeria arxii CBS 175.79 TaxID=1450172 RepID=A0A6A5XHF9_9PLEO|nr:polysaccharide lyase family 7 protein [Aaosphaeria arxii CBS 175.79]KAF2012319.1 polysaccharide lyase family 7 protein [Aaosphaeria arxii CBS 175.79]
MPANPAPQEDLNNKVSPGGNFDLSMFKLQLPTADSDGKVDMITSGLTGASGFKNEYFLTGPDGSLVMKVPSKDDGCATTPNSDHCRTELREDDPKSWDPKAPTNRLAVTLTVVQPDDSPRGTVIGQVKVDDDISKKPLCELYYNDKGDLTLGVNQTPNKSGQDFNPVGNVPVGKEFTYELRYEKSVLSLAINGGEFKTFSTGDIKTPLSYFKVGNYNQGDTASEVKFAAIGIQH